MRHDGCNKPLVSDVSSLAKANYVRLTKASLGVLGSALEQGPEHFHAQPYDGN
jgi:hypothetical protein